MITGLFDDDYDTFLAKKQQAVGDDGFDPVWMPDFLFPFQRHLIEWATRKGRSAIFADCGLDKTPMQLVWAENVVRKTNKNVLSEPFAAQRDPTPEEIAERAAEIRKGR